MERLDKILAGTGRWSRREAAELIRMGRVTVEGKIVAGREEKFPETACFCVDGEDISGVSQIYLMLNKPEGLVSATDDPRQPTVLSLLPEHLRRVGLFPAGRLDKDTVGLLLLTNDGPLAHGLLAPHRHVDKTYLVRVNGTLDESDVAAFQAGLVLESGLHCLPAVLDLQGPNEAQVTLREGKYHQIKRMLAARGKPVTFLKRLAFGPLTLDERLAPGAWRPLSDLELEALRRAGTPGFE
ncbi:MAG: 16S rRNA pseudouridine(516) synthase [Pseudoflavonifractor sp.]|nr:16S rRNA pseudouridine(516) synthase [Pseudoflavonifractor sp.]